MGFMAENSFDFTVVRNLRRKRGLTAEDLARQADITRSTVAKIEGGDANPTVGTIQAIAQVLGLSATELLAMAELSQPALAQSEPFSQEGLKGVRVQLPGLELFVLRAEPGMRASFDPRLHDNTMEVCMVLEGGLTLTVGGVEHRLIDGQALSFRAMQEHRLHSPDGCRLLMLHHNSA